MIKNIKSFLITVLLTLTTTISFAQSASYDPCQGRFRCNMRALTFIYHVWTSNEYYTLLSAKLYYQDINGNWIQYYGMYTGSGASTAVTSNDVSWSKSMGTSDHSATWTCVSKNLGSFVAYSDNTSATYNQAGNYFSPISTNNKHVTSSDVISGGSTITDQTYDDFYEDFSVDFYGIPSELIATGQVKIRIYQNYQNTATTTDFTFNTSSPAGEIQTISSPNNLTATNNLCGQIKLDWLNPTQTWESNVSGCATFQYSNLIFRDGTPIAQVAGDATTYTDNTAVLGTTYSYKIKQIFWNKNAYQFIPSQFSAAVSGNVKPLPPQPISFAATTDNCTGEINLNWSWTSTETPKDFILRYGTSPTGPFTQLPIIANTARQYTHSSLTRGVTYYYQLTARNNCNNESAVASTYGLSPSDPAIPIAVALTQNTLTAENTIRWTDNSTNETKFQIERQDDLGNSVFFDVNPNTTSYVDNNVAACRSYKYYVKVYSGCVLSGLRSLTYATGILPPPDLNGTFTVTKKLNASKGYFGNRVELSWSNNNISNVDLFKIYRKELNTSKDSVQIASLPGVSAFYIDNTADARIFYRYTIVGIKNCLSNEISTNTSSDIGFRSPAGLVSGHIEYAGGVAVGGTKVLVQQSGALTGNSLLFNTNSNLTISDNLKLEPGNELRLEFWYKPVNVSGTFIKKTNSFEFALSGTNYQAKIFTGGVAKTISIPSVSLPTNQWNHVSMIYNGSVFKLFANGILTASTVAIGNIDDNSNHLIIGNASSKFLLDEFRLIGKAATDSVISKEQNRILNGNEFGFKCNLHFDEGMGSYAYDVSKIANTFNENHGVMSGSVTSSSDIPSNAQLGYFGVTDEFGNYNVTGIRYAGLGENFNIVPSFGTHSFSPNSRVVYVGDASYVYNNQDFTDNSSFPFTGELLYKNTSCPVPGATVKIDGYPVVQYGTQVLTDAKGTFSISVPIGKHFISVEKYGHTMELGFYPPTGVHDFQATLPPVQFIDSTRLKIVGRVVGGTVEANKAPGMGRSKNNIGNAKIILASPIVGTPCYTAAVTTNSLTGEYEFNIPPLAYKIVDAYVITNSVTISKTKLSNTNQLIDLTSSILKTTVIDTLFDSNGGVLRIDSIKFNKRLDMVYRSAPKIDMTMLDGSKFIGDDSLKIGNTKINIKPTVGNTGTYKWGPLNWPVFTQNKTYKSKITANEIYTNSDMPSTPIRDTVLLSGNILVTNDLVDGIDPNSAFSFQNGVGTYSFICGSPNIAATTPSSDLDYTKNIQVVVVPDGAASVPWLPNANQTPFHALVIGKRITGTGISTQGPEKVDFILRDPPGSGSSSKWTSGSTVTKSTSLSNGDSKDIGISTDIFLGSKAVVGVGFATEVAIENSISLGLSTNISSNEGSSITEVITSANSVSTRDDGDYVGAPADIFIGRSRNWLVGPTANIEVSTAGCNTCFGPTVNAKQLALKLGYAVAPDNVRTRFSYTQDEIENTVIPQLVAIRNTLLLNSPGKYSTTLAPTHPNFGSNNDDPLWGSLATSTTPAVYDPVDSLGQSYKFKGYSNLVNKDTVRILNTQIALWKQALAQNEREKLACVNNTGGVLIDNFTLGSAIVNNVYQTDNETSSSSDWELQINEDIAGQFGGSVAGAGVLVKPSISFHQTEGGSTSNSTNLTNTFEYTLTDGDPGDIMSIDVYKSPEGTGNIFVTRGGQTMCPYEDAVVCHYYNPANPKAYISSHTYNEAGFANIANATVQREMPNIAITPSNQLNIPSNQAAVYQLVLTNQSPLTINNDIDLQVRIASQSNPNGAVLKIDGQNANSIFNIPSGGSVVKTLTIERGPIEINYDSLMVIFSSACSEDIADTAYVSVHFIPTCTEISISAPTDNFIVNNSNNNIANVVIDNYNYNYGVAANTSTLTNSLHPNFGFEKIGYEIKPGNTSSWLEIKDFYKVPNATQSIIPTNQVYTQYQWTVTPQSYPDGNYEIRAVSYCYNKDGSYATVYSPVLAGVMDRVNPAPFGTPTPGDGILDPNDDISIQFNEPIDLSSLSNSNFDIRGVLNGSNIRHAESLNFDGVADYAEVTGGVSLQKRSFTIEFWAKLNAAGYNQTIISQGTDPVQKMTIEFDNSNNLIFNLGTQTAVSTNAVPSPTDWHHYTVVYDYENTDAILYVDGSSVGTNNNFAADYMGTGKLAFGKALPSNTNFLNGNLHEIRLWNDVRKSSEITVTMNKVLNRNQSGLMYNWKMDEADGKVAKDDIRNRNADIYGATWEVNPNGYSAQFDGIDDNIQVSSGNIAITKEMDFTLEFWFNSTQSGVATLFANGKGDGLGADSLDSWNIQKDAGGLIHVYHQGKDFVATNANHFDGNWHHFALTMNRNGNLSSYIDGNLQNSIQGLTFNNLSGAYMYLGARGYQTGTITNYDNYFNGKIDEFRLWNTARKAEQLKRDKQNRLLGDEYGLQAFLPFEHYATVMGTPSLTATFNNQSANTLTVNAQNGISTSVQTPTIKLPRPIQSVNYTWLLNNDKIILTPTTAPELLENVTLDVTVKNAYDLHGNKMQSPKTWIAYVNKNQVKWQDDQFDFEKTVDSVITFIAPIINTGGALKAFTIDGLPSWMKANITSGVIAPNSVQNIVLTIPAGSTIGDYSANISVTTDFKYAEILQINLKVKGVSPTWEVNPSNFQYSMNIFGQLKIDNVIATNLENKIAAFSNGVLCGVANLEYLKAYDRYEVFLNVYSNKITGDSIQFNIYDAASGLTFVKVAPNLMFVENEVIGTVTNPITFIANTEIEIKIPLNNGWTWFSLPLRSSNLASSNLLLNNLNSTTGNIVLSNSSFDQYDSKLNWLGNISQGAGFFNNQSYKIKSASSDTLIHIGTRISPNVPMAAINVQPGWNWIGYISTKNTKIEEALGNYNAKTGDLLKSQYEFAYYDNLTGWTGSLTHMKPAMGYMLKSSTNSSFSYPLSSYNKKLSDGLIVSSDQTVFPFNPEFYDYSMSAIISSNFCNEVLEQGNVLLGAFDANQTMRGYAYPIKNAKTQTYNYYLTLYSNTDGDRLNLKYFNAASGSVLNTSSSITFTTNALAGLPSKPILSSVSDSVSCKVTSNITTVTNISNSANLSVYPNPFSNNLTLSFGKGISAKIQLIDVLGKVIYSCTIKDKKEQVIELDENQNLASGMYYLRISGDINQQLKVVKTN